MEAVEAVTVVVTVAVTVVVTVVELTENAELGRSSYVPTSNWL